MRISVSKQRQYRTQYTKKEKGHLAKRSVDVSFTPLLVCTNTKKKKQRLKNSSRFCRSRKLKKKKRACCHNHSTASVTTMKEVNAIRLLVLFFFFFSCVCVCVYSGSSKKKNTALFGPQFNTCIYKGKKKKKSFRSAVKAVEGIRREKKKTRYRKRKKKDAFLFHNNVRFEGLFCTVNCRKKNNIFARE